MNTVDAGEVTGGADARPAVGPIALFTAWVLHDIEEAIAFPATCDRLAETTGIEQLRMSTRQSWVAVGLMGVVVALACRAGVRSSGRSKWYRAVVAGLEGHVLTHVLASAMQRRYTAGVATAVPVMWPGSLLARRELRRSGAPLTAGDTVRGAVLLLPAAALCQQVARLVPSGRASREQRPRTSLLNPRAASAGTRDAPPVSPERARARSDRYRASRPAAARWDRREASGIRCRSRPGEQRSS